MSSRTIDHQGHANSACILFIPLIQIHSLGIPFDGLKTSHLGLHACMQPGHLQARKHEGPSEVSVASPKGRDPAAMLPPEEEQRPQGNVHPETRRLASPRDPREPQTSDQAGGRRNPPTRPSFLPPPHRAAPGGSLTLTAVPSYAIRPPRPGEGVPSPPRSPHSFALQGPEARSGPRFPPGSAAASAQAQSARRSRFFFLIIKLYWDTEK